MKIFFEEYVYEWDAVREYLHDHYVMYLKGGRVMIPYVGYYYSAKAEDSVFILPKVFINIDEQKEEKAFGIFKPEDIIDTNDEKNPLLKSQYFNEVFNLSTWIYRAIARYQERHCKRAAALSGATLRTCSSTWLIESLGIFFRCI